MSVTMKVPDYDRVWEEVYGDMQHDGPVHRHMKRILGRLLGHLQYDSVLDVGCGPGHNFPLLSQGRSLRRVTGVDISARAIEHAKDRWDGDFFQLDVQQERLPGSWDLVFSSLLLEHLPDDVAALTNMRAMTGKYLLVTTIGGDFERYRPWDERVGHVRNYRVGELEAKLQKTGFALQTMIYWGFPFFSPVARVLQNRSSLGTGRFGWTARVAARFMDKLYFCNSHRRGDLLIALATIA